jgi:Ca2+:H+ antiporter
VSRILAPEPLYLSFGRVEIGVLFLAVMIGTLISGDGRGNWFKGVQLVVVYAIFALLFFLVPEVPA